MRLYDLLISPPALMHKHTHTHTHTVTTQTNQTQQPKQGAKVYATTPKVMDPGLWLPWFLT